MDSVRYCVVHEATVPTRWREVQATATMSTVPPLFPCPQSSHCSNIYSYTVSMLLDLAVFESLSQYRCFRFLCGCRPKT